jgi:DnaK suppressor protein
MLNNFNRGVFMTKTKDTSKAGKAKKIKAVQPSTAKGTAASSVKKAPVKKQAPVKSKTPAKQQKTAVAPKAPEKKSAARVPVLQAAKKTKAKLSPRDQKLHQIRLILLKQRTALLDEAESALNELPGQTTFPDLGDQATAETDRNFMLRLRGREQRLLKKIDDAIERIDTGTFGICDDCGNEIGIKRLEARPVTTMCIECKTLQEEEEKLRES